MDARECSVLDMLDLSAAFDTVIIALFWMGKKVLWLFQARFLTGFHRMNFIGPSLCLGEGVLLPEPL